MAAESDSENSARSDHSAHLSRPTFIAIHARDEKATILFISSGIRQCMGYRPEELVSKSGHEFIADSSNSDYPQVYASKSVEDDAERAGGGGDDEASVFVMFVNGTTPSGSPVLHKITSFTADSCVVCLGMAYPEIPFVDRKELEVKMLDRAMESLNVTRDREQQAARQRQQAAKGGGRGQVFSVPSRRPKAVMVLEHPEVACVETEESGRRPSGPLIAFCTGSVSRLVDADSSDLMSFPFLKLVAPEDVALVGRYFDEMSGSHDVLFETFSLLQRPHVIEGDIFVSDEKNMRVVVECMGAAVNDGVAILMRMLRTVLPPQRDRLGNYIHAPAASDSDKDEMSLLDLLSTDPGTSDAPECWSHLR
ncbi:hypothetical protein IWW36_002401 [Coemansia brasiliensis]|uniref:PAS domain-containing protein n=1 Tax=Coemansia brasiliensis TaxID=2650707 RepID=A0A9W8LY58_9FUNG|nr:hypothetical protein IWW36_002401 [Coemansia brasiliensis]